MTAQGPVTLRVMIVDDEPLARLRMRALLGECVDPSAMVVAEAGDAVSAVDALTRHACDVLLLDIHMPGTDGLALAEAIRQLPSAPAVVFVTAHAEHALKAFELDAVDYLTKPVRKERLISSLRKVKRTLPVNQAQGSDSSDNYVLISDRGRTERVPLHEVVYLKAELKYVTVRTCDRELIYDGSLAEFEERHGAHWLRVHRNALVARHAVRALEKHHDPVEGGEGWAVRMNGVAEVLTVSRRQLASVREALGKS